MIIIENVLYYENPCLFFETKQINNDIGLILKLVVLLTISKIHFRSMTSMIVVVSRFDTFFFRSAMILICQVVAGIRTVAKRDILDFW